jgi:hypothetical protein
MCIFDGCIVIISWLELLVLAESSGFSVLRGFRLLRIFKLLKKWKALKRILHLIIKAIPLSANLGLLMVLYVFINALIGKQFFYGDLPGEDGEPAPFAFTTIG